MMACNRAAPAVQSGTSRYGMYQGLSSVRGYLSRYSGACAMPPMTATDKNTHTTAGIRFNMDTFSQRNRKMSSKIVVLASAIFFFCCGAAHAEGALAKTSYEKTADAVIVASACYITAVQVITDGSNAARVIIYDNASAASGNVITEITVAGADNYGGRVWQMPVECKNGIYADVNGTGASYVVEWLNK